MPVWNQIYTPVAGSVGLSALVAALPVAVLLGLLALGHTRAHWAALSGLATALLVAVAVFGMPARLAGIAALNGAAYGLLPIGWIVLGAIFVYDVTVASGKFEVVQHTVAGLSADRRIQALLIAYCFGAFIESAAGFGTPVAICGAMLIALGFRPLEAAGLALIGNTAPVAFGALGTPIVALASVTGLPVETLSAAVGRQLAVFGVLIPFWLIWTMAGRNKMMEVWPACLTVGVSFAATQLLVSNAHGPWVVGIAAAAVSLLSLVVLLRFWQPRTIWSFGHEAPGREAAAAAAVPRHTPREELLAWMPWILLSVLVFMWGLPPVKSFLNGGAKDHPNFLHGAALFEYHVPVLDKAVVRTAPVAAKAAAEPAVFAVNLFSATGTSLFLAGMLGGLLLGFSPVALLRIWWRTLWRLRISLLTIVAMLALGFTTRYAGLDATMGLAFAGTGLLFPFFSPLLGWLGVALTGSDTSSNVMFGGLQQVTARQLGISPVFAAASNSVGGVMGKMIDAQSIVVAGVATGQQGGEGNILRYVFWHSLALACLVGAVVFLQATFLAWTIPAPR